MTRATPEPAFCPYPTAKKNKKKGFTLFFKIEDPSQRRQKHYSILESCSLIKGDDPNPIASINKEDEQTILLFLYQVCGLC